MPRAGESITALVGERFTRLVVTAVLSAGRREVQCDCGSPPRVVLANNLVRGDSRSCGCRKRELLAERCRKSRRGSLEEGGWKTCSRCLSKLLVERFPKNCGRKDGLGAACKGCSRGSQLATRYNLSNEDYERLLSAMNDCCVLCVSPLGVPSKGMSHPVDHNHTTGEVRGIVHHTCNITIGYAEKYPDKFLAALPKLIEYANAALAALGMPKSSTYVDQQGEQK